MGGRKHSIIYNSHTMGRLEMVQTLVLNGADKMITDQHGARAIDSAVSPGWLFAIKLEGLKVISGWCSLPWDQCRVFTFYNFSHNRSAGQRRGRSKIGSSASKGIRVPSVRCSSVSDLARKIRQKQEWTPRLSVTTGQGAFEKFLRNIFWITKRVSS